MPAEKWISFPPFGRQVRRGSEWVTTECGHHVGFRPQACVEIVWIINTVIRILISWPRQSAPVQFKSGTLKPPAHDVNRVGVAPGTLSEAGDTKENVFK
jgi:hypothetical protein